MDQIRVKISFSENIFYSEPLTMYPTFGDPFYDLFDGSEITVDDEGFTTILLHGYTQQEAFDIAKQQMDYISYAVVTVDVVDSDVPALVYYADYVTRQNMELAAKAEQEAKEAAEEAERQRIEDAKKVSLPELDDADALF